ncbi:hypothetical protein QBC46DRAFT_345340 [Diplogelasinospora grovesii]|uniref:Uncharacterized protein n=1 Tax=Diplogelasinospora grovesii TaxID=303347 RepID=A0AAN6S175_9PEZI|nr:hypothetical protein QBC46DRAFT_345340 [Diplogelasinospora grovesii]
MEALNTSTIPKPTPARNSYEDLVQYLIEANYAADPDEEAEALAEALQPGEFEVRTFLNSIITASAAATEAASRATSPPRKNKRVRFSKDLEDIRQTETQYDRSDCDFVPTRETHKSNDLPRGGKLLSWLQSSKARKAYQCPEWGMCCPSNGRQFEILQMPTSASNFQWYADLLGLDKVVKSWVVQIAKDLPLTSDTNRSSESESSPLSTNEKIQRSMINLSYQLWMLQSESRNFLRRVNSIDLGLAPRMRSALDNLLGTIGRISALLAVLQRDDVTEQNRDVARQNIETVEVQILCEDDNKLRELGEHFNTALIGVYDAVGSDVRERVLDIKEAVGILKLLLSLDNPSHADDNAGAIICLGKLDILDKILDQIPENLELETGILNTLVGDIKRFEEVARPWSASLYVQNGDRVTMDLRNLQEYVEATLVVQCTVQDICKTQEQWGEIGRALLFAYHQDRAEEV